MICSSDEDETQGAKTSVESVSGGEAVTSNSKRSCQVEKNTPRLESQDADLDAEGEYEIPYYYLPLEIVPLNPTFFNP